ncbi:MAG: hypothetical protein SOW50_08660 [Lachnospiraceae bacterium]|nr:hypothetical protein [Lachnospiraceae bacterium]
MDTKLDYLVRIYEANFETEFLDEGDYYSTTGKVYHQAYISADTAKNLKEGDTYKFADKKYIYEGIVTADELFGGKSAVYILNNNTLETMRSAGIERFGEPGYGGSIKRLLEIIKSDPKNKPLLREIIKAEKELLLFIYDEHTDLTEEYIRNYWKEFFEAYCHVLEQNNGRESNARAS